MILCGAFLIGFIVFAVVTASLSFMFWDLSFTNQPILTTGRMFGFIAGVSFAFISFTSYLSDGDNYY